MAKRYDHRIVEQEAQKKWAELELYKTDLADSTKDPYYLLFEFPYPSGDLHIGHWYAFAVTDIFARMKRMLGKNVLFPIGFDAFGLPAENAAMKNGADPREWTYANMDRMREQIKSMGTSVDWSKEVVTCDPEYYHWTQWLFSKLYEHNLAERKEAAVKWCPKDKTVLANEQVIDGHCERCGSVVEEKRLTQWFMKITQYAERLLNHLDELPWREEIKDAQRAWIGKSEGAKISFPIAEKRKYVLLHGFKGTPEDNGWYKQMLTQAGNEVTIPTLPNTAEPKEDEWVAAALDAASYDASTVLFGHSLGSVAALKVLEKLDAPIDAAIFAGGFIDPAFADHPRNFEKTFKWDFDWKKIKGNASRFVVLQDKNDSAVSRDQAQRLADALGVEITLVTANEDHFCATQEPEVLKALMVGSDTKIEVFTTRPDTLYGATYLVLAPEHTLVTELLPTVSNKQEVVAYMEATKRKTERERSENKEKTGIELKGITAVNPVNGEPIPVYVADYVLGSYGTGAVMAVPAHDERDFEFAKKHGLPVRHVVAPRRYDPLHPHQDGKELVARDAAISIVHDSKTDRYLCLKWKKFPWTTFVTGGVESGEQPVDAAMREIGEETGYQNVQFVRVLGKMRSEFFAAHKDVNRVALNTVLLFELIDDAKASITDEELAKHEPVWLTREELEATKLEHSELSDLLGQLFNPTAIDEDGVLVDSSEFSGRDNREAMWDIVAKAGGQRVTNYRIRDWLVSRQRYWGCPIPVVYDPEGKPHLVPADHLPWLLPTDVDFTPNDAGAPLATSKELKERVTKLFGEGWTPEYDTLDTFVDSSWYFLRYLDPKDQHDFSDQAMLKKWMPVQRYSGGSEHTTMHLLYARFFTKALHDLALVPVDEPFVERYNRGIILGPDGAKMSKSKGNVINPDAVVKEHGADAVRMYLAFIGPYNEPGHYPWNLEGVSSMRKFLERIVALSEKLNDDAAESTMPALARAEAKVKTEAERFKFNTAISALMVLVRDLEELPTIPREAYRDVLRMTAPFAPHLMEHLWAEVGGQGSVHAAPWPTYDATLLATDTVTIGVQVSGKRRGDITLSLEATEAEALAEARKIPAVEAALGGRDPARVVYVPGKILNLVAG